MTITNLNSVLRQLREFGQGMREGAAQGLTEEARRVYDTSQPLVPIAEGKPDAGRLKASGYVTEVEDQGGVLSVEVGYSADYALEVHEDASAFHDQGQSKYLEAAVHQTAPGRAARIGAAAVAAANRRAGRR